VFHLFVFYNVEIYRR